MHPEAAVRETVAPMLAGLPGARAALTDALARERSGKVRQALEAALSRV